PQVPVRVRGPMSYAIFSIGAVQYRAEPGITIKVPLLQGEPGSKVTFDRVLLASDGTHVHTGKPVLKGAKVTAEVVRHGKGKKIRIYRFRSEEHTSELQSRFDLVCRLLLEKKKNT